MGPPPSGPLVLAAHALPTLSLAQVPGHTRLLKAHGSGKKPATKNLNAALRAEWPFAAPDSWNLRRPSRCSPPLLPPSSGALFQQRMVQCTPLRELQHSSIELRLMANHQ